MPQTIDAGASMVASTMDHEMALSATGSLQVLMPSAADAD
jgi:hypothetical protein